MCMSAFHQVTQWPGVISNPLKFFRKDELVRVIYPHLVISFLPRICFMLEKPP